MSEHERCECSGYSGPCPTKDKFRRPAEAPAPAQPVTHSLAAFEIVLHIHTEEGAKQFDSPDNVRSCVGAGIEDTSFELEEEVDFTLEVKRIHQPPAQPTPYNPYELCPVCLKPRMRHDNPAVLCVAQPTPAEPSAEVLPCPFCGCQAWLHEHDRIFDGYVGYRVECEGTCHSMTCYWHTREQAQEAWNRRTPAVAPASEEEVARIAEKFARALNVAIHDQVMSLTGAEYWPGFSRIAYDIDKAIHEVADPLRAELPLAETRKQKVGE